MLESLSINNYALIENLNVNFQDGFSIITGETGAGKSILLGGLALILGKRADLSILKDKEKKCIIEGAFSIAKYKLETFFEVQDIDFEPTTIIRREILPNGKSRAFINDTPTTLNVLTELSSRLIDVHSQHQTLELADKNFQYLIIDALAANSTLLSSFKKGLSIYRKLQNELDEILARQQEAQEQYEYHSFLLKELTEADFKKDEQELLEESLDKLNHVEEIKTYLIEAQALAQSEEIGLQESLNKYASLSLKLSKFSKEYIALSERVISLKIDFEDIATEFDHSLENLETDPRAIEKLNNRLQLLYDLQKKHKVDTIEELIEKRMILEVKVSTVENATAIVHEKQNEIAAIGLKLDQLAASISLNRKKAIPLLTSRLEAILKDLEMPNTQFKIVLSSKEGFLKNGKDELAFQISTNKGTSFEDLKKVASGGEMSRIMLAVKSILSDYTNLPTIIFDEIDTGVSGEVANRIATVMSTMSVNMQVIAITHLPQIAASGQHHYKVFKSEVKGKTVTDIKILNESERVSELAEMLSGKDIADSAVVHAKQLLKQ